MMGWRRSQSDFGAKTTAEQVTEGVDASKLTAIVTGATSGIGTDTARVLPLRGAHVFVGGRKVESATSTKENVLKELPNARVDILAPLDLNSQESIRKSAQSFLALNRPLNLLINNAGVMLTPYGLTEDGIETHFRINHVGHFLLTNLILDKLKETANTTGIESRIVNVSSVAMGMASKTGVRWDTVNEKKGYSPVGAYSLSKIANFYHAQELTRRLQEERVTNVTINSLRPGIILTNLMQHIHGGNSYNMRYNIHEFRNKISNRFGAATTCYVAVHPSLKGVSGKLYSDCQEVNASKLCPLADDRDAATKLWDFSLKLTTK